MEHTIAAISTAPGEGAVAVLRLSGPEAVAVASKFFVGRHELAKVPVRRVLLGRIEDGGQTVDQVLATVYRAPASYTGEDMVEVSCHGGVLVAARILQLFLSEGARAAGPGEFTQRAFLNGKMDLTQAEAVMDLIRARTPLALRAAAEQLGGRIGEGIRELRESLLGVVAHLEAYIDFPEEGIDPETGQAMQATLELVAARIEKLLATADEGRILREGVRLAICGRPNAGKSSLLNRLLGFERAIVSEIPGTTRDTIEEFASLRGIPFRVIDTAGIRESRDLIEAEGIERARKAMEQADLILEVIDLTSEQPALPDGGELPRVIALNKCDLVSTSAGSAIEGCRISCQTGEGLDALVDALVAAAGHHHLAAGQSPAAINARHQACLQRALRSLREAAAALAAGTEPELVAVDLRAALDAVGEVVGAVDSDEILGKIFSTFCIGK